MKLQITPRISADGKYIALRVESNYTDLAGTPVQIPITRVDTRMRMTSGEEPKMVTVHTPTSKSLQMAPGCTYMRSAEATVTLLPGGTVVINSEAAAGDRKGKPGGEVLWVLTPHVIRGQGKADGGGKTDSPIRP